ncbi:MAG TPA: GGDEF domain-containing protein [Frankiaceae bacterium]|jgi:diguanylate cyclase (GGDEF)-like protein|nr:GGDEF domain-containing protein [Frankiaceae bacterium]
MRRRGRLLAAAGVALLAVLFFALELHLKWGGARARKDIDDLGELAAAGIASACGIRRAIRTSGRARLSWLFIGAGAGCWAAGQGVWSYYELIGHRQTPFPSLADAGFLSFTGLAMVGLLVRRSFGLGRHRRSRALLDGMLVAASLFVLTWVTALGQVYAAGADSTFAAVVSMAYPVGDLMLMTLTLVVVAHARPDARQGLSLLAAAFAALSVGDSGFAYLTATGQYQTGNLVDAGWVIGFLLLAFAAAVPEPDYEPRNNEVTSRAALLLPYAPALLALVITTYRVRSTHHDDISLLAAAFVVLILLIRQMLILDENRQLTSAVRHQAFHDQLTGLANRALFQDRLSHALELHRGAGRPLALLILDLDDFKAINDTLGHAAGDEVLRQLAYRLRSATKTGDTVARLGGDEFAILGEVGTDRIVDGKALSARVMAGLDEPFLLEGAPRIVRASIGVAELGAGDEPIDADELLQRADAAMYTGKRRGKAQVVHYESPRLIHPAALYPHRQPVHS